LGVAKRVCSVKLPVFSVFGERRKLEPACSYR